MTTPPVAPRVSVVVLSHNRPGMLAEALASVRRQTYQPLDIVVVDNPSPASPAVATLVQATPGVRLVRPAENVGFTGGMNCGIQAVDGAYTYLTEDDLVLEPDCIAQFVAYLRLHPAIGLAGGCIRDREDGSILYAGGDVVLDSAFHLTLPGRGTAGPIGGPGEVTYVPGSSVFARTALLKRYGGFRQDFFMYMDDVELCLRVRQAGDVLAFVPAAQLWHFRPSGAPTADAVRVHKWKNLIAVYILHARPAATVAFVLRTVIGQLVRGGAPHERRIVLLAVAWVVRHLPTLLRDRCATDPARGTSAPRQHQDSSGP